ncbi:uncharacterized protein LOC119949922 [Tachyglossus aculeatus]|uniref:uncharacterized protein LOC119949922 n=1 Tax=Tachyglossus aculeatus TaxID=9261 RepID=UPI0018F69EE8|nr:uncharacterized protein LOC119949922 [Tachyglossus aculeatus]
MVRAEKPEVAQAQTAPNPSLLSRACAHGPAPSSSEARVRESGPRRPSPFLCPSPPCAPWEGRCPRRRAFSAWLEATALGSDAGAPRTPFSGVCVCVRTRARDSPQAAIFSRPPLRCPGQRAQYSTAAADAEGDPLPGRQGFCPILAGVVHCLALGAPCTSMLLEASTGGLRKRPEKSLGSGSPAVTVAVSAGVGYGDYGTITRRSVTGDDSGFSRRDLRDPSSRIAGQPWIRGLVTSPWLAGSRRAGKPL